jgi:DNA-binding NarL/FixJ family response regulator
MIEIAIIEDDAVIRDDLKRLFESADDMQCIGAFEKFEDAMEILKKEKPDVVLLDIRLPGIDGIEGMKEVKPFLSETDFLMLTVHEESELVFRALKSGATGYLDKSASEEKILSAIREIYDGGAPMTSRIARLVLGSFRAAESSDLTVREKDVLEALVNGNTYKEISYNLKITVGTVRHHIKSIYRKLHVHSKSEAVARALKDKIV